MGPKTLISIVVGLVLAFLAGRFGKRKAAEDAKTVEKINAMSNSEVADDIAKRIK